MHININSINIVSRYRKLDASSILVDFQDIDGAIGRKDPRWKLKRKKMANWNRENFSPAFYVAFTQLHESSLNESAIA